MCLSPGALPEKPDTCHELFPKRYLIYSFIGESIHLQECKKRVWQYRYKEGEFISDTMPEKNVTSSMKAIANNPSFAILNGKSQSKESNLSLIATHINMRDSKNKKRSLFRKDMRDYKPHSVHET